MSDVVLRCPHCGTTQETPGECEACHEDSVRYFCPNHTPGRWLDGRTCAECEAREARERVAEVGRERGRTVPPIKPMPPASPPPLSPPPREWSPRKAPPPAPPRPAPFPTAPPFGEPFRDVRPPVPRPGTPRRSPGIDVEGPYTYPEPPRDDRRDVDVGAPPDWRGELAPMLARRALPGAVGCLKKLLVLGLIIAILFAIASAWFFSSVFVGSTGHAVPRDVAVRRTACHDLRGNGRVGSVGTRASLSVEELHTAGLARTRG